MSKKLTAKQEKFCQAVVSGMSQADAYRKAFDVKPGTKASSVQDSASKLMQTPLVSQRVADLTAQIAEKFVIDDARLLQESARLAFLDPGKLIDEQGRIRMINELDADTRAAISSVEITPEGLIKYKFWDKNSALERLFKHKALFEKHNAQKGLDMNALAGALGSILAPNSCANDNG